MAVVRDMSSLYEVLDSDARAYDAQFRDGLSNHLPMTLVALAKLGADETRVSAFRDKYITRLERTPSSRTPITRETAPRVLGTHERYTDFFVFFDGEISRESDACVVVREFLPMLMRGVAAAAFHGVIRLAYAVGAGDASKSEIAAALAYFADTCLPLDANADANANTDADVLGGLRRLSLESLARGFVPGGGLIFDDLERVASDVGTAALLRWAPSACTCAEAARAALVIYASTRSFTALHCVTGAHALRVLSPLQSDRDARDACAHLSRALFAAYITMGAPALLSPAELTALSEREAPSWEEIAARACDSDDEHVIKIVLTSREEDAAYADPLYRVVAARAAKLID
jgi:hypothetical protein